ncbi:MAG: HEAT repeat domain-containing protein [Myxococcota bacterium]
MSRKLLYACFEAGADPDPEKRLGALRVAANLDPTDTVRIADPLIRDPDGRVRRYAFSLACAAKEHGIECLRTAVNGNDTELAVDALGLLVMQLDRPSSMHARAWLRHDDPRIRAGAAILLGNVAGPAMAVHLGRLADTDPIASVRTIAAEAVGRATGDIPKIEGRPFWEEGPIDLQIDLTPAAPKTTGLPPRLPGQGLATLFPEDGFGDASDGEDDAEAAAEAGSSPSPSADDATLIPITEEVEDVREPTARDWREPAPLPAALPTEALALVKLVGMVRAEDRPAVVRAFQAADGAAQAQVLGSWKPSGDADVGRGIALVVKALDSKTHASMLRVMLRESAPGVRAAAAEAIGATGTLSMIPQLSDLLADGDADVRVAAVRSLSELLTRMERFAMLKERIAPMKQDPDDAVKAAAEAALQAAG